MLAMEVWTPQEYKETPNHVRVSMNEQVTLYLSKYRNKHGRYFTDVYFYGPNHAKRAQVYATLTGMAEKDIYRGRTTATTVRVPR